jgi:hypothetical protein
MVISIRQARLSSYSETRASTCMTMQPSCIYIYIYIYTYIEALDICLGVQYGPGILTYATGKPISLLIWTEICDIYDHNRQSS